MHKPVSKIQISPTYNTIFVAALITQGVLSLNSNVEVGTIHRASITMVKDFNSEWKNGNCFKLTFLNPYDSDLWSAFADDPVCEVSFDPFDS